MGNGKNFDQRYVSAAEIGRLRSDHHVLIPEVFVVIKNRTSNGKFRSNSVSSRRVFPRQTEFDQNERWKKDFAFPLHCGSD